MVDVTELRAELERVTQLVEKIEHTQAEIDALKAAKIRDVSGLGLKELALYSVALEQTPDLYDRAVARLEEWRDAHFGSGSL